ncbi:hypothetical protein [Gardnerella vaginalis]|uniref:hypothetical protein n=1 Tax=Gardnerella sp. DNF01205 TaxID=2749069 RepID=UPI000E2EB930
MNENTVKKIIGDLESLIGHLKEITGETTHKTLPKQTPETKKVSLEDVRAVLAKLSQLGKTAEVKKLIVKHGAQKLSDIPESEYASLLHEAEGIKGD